MTEDNGMDMPRAERRRGKVLAYYLAAVSAFLFVFSASLPDGDVGSPRSIVLAAAGGLVATAAVLRGPS